MSLTLHHDLVSGLRTRDDLGRGDLHQGGTVRRRRVSHRIGHGVLRIARGMDQVGGVRAPRRSRHQKLRRRKPHQSLHLRLHRTLRRRHHQQRLHHRRRLRRRRRRHHQQRHRHQRRGRRHRRQLRAGPQGRQAYRRRPQVRLRAYRFKPRETGLFKTCPVQSRHACRSRI